MKNSRKLFTKTASKLEDESFHDLDDIFIQFPPKDGKKSFDLIIKNVFSRSFLNIQSGNNRY